MKKSIIILLSFAYFYSAFAAEEFRIDPKTSQAIPNFAGKVLMVKGEVNKLVKKAGNDDVYTRRLAVGSLIKEGDTITSKARSFAKVRMSDDTMLTVGPKSEIVIEKFEFHTKSNRNVVYNLIDGRIRTYILKKVKKPYTVKIKSRYASLGVRGTEVLANHVKNNLNNFQTEFALVSGKAMITDKASNTKIPIKSGQRVVLYGGEPGNDSPFKKIEINNALMKQLISDSYDEKKFPKLLNPLVADNRVMLNSVERELGEQRPSSEAAKKQSSWKDKLKKLNKLLEENCTLD